MLLIFALTINECSRKYCNNLYKNLNLLILLNPNNPRSKKKSRPAGRDLLFANTVYYFLGVVLAAGVPGAPAGSFIFSFLATKGSRLSAGGATINASWLYT